MELHPGQRIAAPFLSAPAEVKTFTPRRGYARLEVVLEDGHHTFQSLQVFDEQLARIDVLATAALTQAAFLRTCFVGLARCSSIWLALDNANSLQ
jgi:hypothetical protein